MTHNILCPLCGESYAPQDGHSTCSACPLHTGCSLVRCPTCGFETVDPSRSGLVRLVERLLQVRNRRFSSGSYRPDADLFPR